MDLRKIQKTGGSSFTITLPKQWVKDNSITEKNEIITFPLSNGKLMIKLYREEKNHTAIIDIDRLEDSHISREIIGHYIAGVNEIVILSSLITYTQRGIVRSTSYKLTGFEIYESTIQKIILKNVSNSTIKAPEHISRILNTIHSMYQDLLTSITDNNKKLAQDIIDRDIEVDRIYLTINRQFHQLLNSLIPSQDHLSLTDLQYLNILGVRLERIADHIVRIAKTITQLKKNEKIKLSQTENNSLKKISQYLELINKMIVDKDKKLAHELLDIYSQKIKNQFINKTINDKPSINILIEDSIERIRGYAANIAEETINYLNMKNI